LLHWDHDVRGHGTHLAGIINSIANNSIGSRGIGTIPIFITRGLDDHGQARESDIRNAMEQCEEFGAKVINLSLSGTKQD
jgi:subtilisin family serine protease